MFLNTRKSWLASVITLLICLVFGTNAEAQEYEPNWESLSKHQEVPEWIRDAKFGIYVHWGVYSVPAYNNEHYYSHMHNTAPYAKLGTHRRHEAVYGPLSEFGYHDFIPRFKGENFDAQQWAELFVKGGARFAGMVAEHHDGFAMWDSKWTPFDTKEMGPKRDIVEELSQALRAKDVKFVASLHHALNYGYVDPKPQWEASDPKYNKLYGTPMAKEKWLEMWVGKSNEVVDKFMPDLMYFDYWLKEIPDEYVKDYVAHYLNAAEEKDKDVIITYKEEGLPEDVGMKDHEIDGPDEIVDKSWLSDMPIGTGASYSWGYVDAMKIHGPEYIIEHLIDVVSKNGQLMLNLSPKADGTIPQNQKDVVHRVGRWLWSFGESIYETRPFAVHGETTENEHEVRYTQKGDYVYAIFMDWPGVNTEINLEELNKQNLDDPLSDVKLLGLEEIHDASFEEASEGIGITLTVPDARLPDEFAVVFRFETE
ncbi:alpha-L-fucosidase [Aliifodinibius sp. S!AR15-10]|uniref:alpha-L-fucosidase n=1 Tax=Aliifodinibius sp. S!AR15-10 TaxID=2950437 RepID=UPI0028580BC1|nr:alpha-L-fucosidase [Aliifodinibius sp. S!AR15-10]MDR8391951.1 alpha-L-fucosidase [Aliifodinibius sp. S!AR15-10]